MGTNTNNEKIRKSGYIFIIFVLFLYLGISVSTAEVCFAGSSHICKDYVDNDGNGVCDLDSMNDQYPAGYKPSSSPPAVPTSNTSVNASDTDGEQTENPESNLYYDPETNTYFDLNKFGYYRTGSIEYSDEELEERWNEIIEEKGIEIPESNDKSDEELDEILSSATSLSLDSVLENSDNKQSTTEKIAESDPDLIDTTNNEKDTSNNIDLESILENSSRLETLKKDYDRLLSQAEHEQKIIDELQTTFDKLIAAKGSEDLSVSQLSQEFLDSHGGSYLMAIEEFGASISDHQEKLAEINKKISDLKKKISEIK